MSDSHYPYEFKYRITELEEEVIRLRENQQSNFDFCCKQSSSTTFSIISLSVGILACYFILYIIS